MDTKSPPSPDIPGWWQVNDFETVSGREEITQALFDVKKPLFIVEKNGGYSLGQQEKSYWGETPRQTDDLPVRGYVSGYYLNSLGDSTFCADHNINYPYVAGGMANGICSTEIVENMGKNGMLGFFGAAGLSLTKIEDAIDRLSGSLGKTAYGFNLIHSPNDPALESATVNLYINRKIRLIEAAAFLDLTLPVVRYRVNGIHRDTAGRVITPNRIIAKVSRIEVASKFFAPPPERFLKILIEKEEITKEQAELAREIPMAQDITAEADSGGHTDNRPALTLIPTMMALRDQMQAKYSYKQRLRVGAAGGIATPASAAAMFSMGAAYIVTGTVNQSCIESGTSDTVREMLAKTRQADITMAPAADMFEMGVKVQVLKHGTMFAMRAAKLYELYRNYGDLDSIPRKDRAMLEKNLFCSPLERIWDETREYFSHRDPSQIERAEKEGKHKMALVFRWYLGQSSHWANSGIPTRKIDYQIWCGPAMGAFNEWVKGSFLENCKNRKVVTVALNLLYGAAICMRINTLRCQGIRLSSDDLRIKPLKSEQIMTAISC